MTLADLQELARRRWYVFVIFVGAALMIAVLLQAVPRTYTAQSEVTFAPPAEVSATTEYNSYAETMINYAGAVDRSYNSRFPSSRLSAPYATLFGNNERLGISVGISKVGTQWTNGFDRPVIVIDVNETSEAVALEKLYSAVHNVERTSQYLQEEANVPMAQRISVQWDEQEVVVGSFGNTRESLAKGSLALVIAALVFSVLIARCIDYFIPRLKQSALRDGHKPEATPGDHSKNAIHASEQKVTVGA